MTLAAIKDVLNGGPWPFRAELRKYVNAWLAVDRDETRFQNLRACQQLNSALARMHPAFVEGQFAMTWRVGTSRCEVTPGGDVKVELEGDGRPRAARAMTHLLLDPERGRLGKCDRCGRYYLGQKRANKRFCSRSCQSTAGAKRTNRAMRARERAAKLERARAALGRLPARHRAAWKRWVAARAKVTTNFLTRAAARGEIVPPPKGVTHAKDAR